MSSRIEQQQPKNKNKNSNSESQAATINRYWPNFQRLEVHCMTEYERERLEREER